MGRWQIRRTKKHRGRLVTGLDPFDAHVGLTEDDPFDDHAPAHWYDGADRDAWRPDQQPTNDHDRKPMTTTETEFTGWAILELMGHKRLAGTAMIRIDVPGDEDGDTTTQLYNPSAIYCLTPCDEATARRVAKTTTMAPVTRWQIRVAEGLVAAIEAGDVEEDVF